MSRTMEKTLGTEDKQSAGERPKTEAPPSAAEAKRLIREVAGQIAELQSEARALTEAQRLLANEEGALQQSMVAAQGERTRLEEELEQRAQKVRELAHQAELVRQETELLERQRLDNLQRAERLAQEARDLTDELCGMRKEIAAAEAELGLERDSVARLVQRAGRRRPDR